MTSRLINFFFFFFFFFKPNRKYCEDYKDFDSELRQNLGPQLGSTLAGLPIKAELYALA